MKVKTTKPPGRQLIKQMPLRLKWVLLASLGLLLLSAGIYTFGEAIVSKGNGATRWIPLSIYGLLLINVGVVFVAQAMVLKVKMEYRREMRREIKKVERQNEYANRKGGPKPRPTEAQN